MLIIIDVINHINGDWSFYKYMAYFNIIKT